jgi:hypothetical protein
MLEFPNDKRYESMQYNRCGKSGLKLPAISLGLWHNFGHANSPQARSVCFTAAICSVNRSGSYPKKASFAVVQF